MNELQIFKNDQFGEIRTITIEDKPYFMASDVAKALGYSNISDAVNRHCRAIVKHDTPISGKIQEVNFIPEGDVYRLCFRSQLEQAEKFESWVVDDVLPSIRKNGGYIANQENLTNEQILANAYVLAQKIMAEKDKLLLVQNQQITELQPKATYYDKVLQSDSLMTTSQVAQDYGMTAQKLNSLLHELGVQYKQSGVWLLYSSYVGYAYTHTKTHSYTDSQGRPQTRVHTYWTQKGRLFIYDLLKQNGVLPTIEVAS